MPHPRPILLLEDDDADATLIATALEELGVTAPLVRLRGGDEAVAWLREHRADERSRPHVLFVDLNMPAFDGRSFLMLKGAHRQLENVPVIVLSSSDAPGDVRFAYRAGASAYQVKPADYTGLVEMLRTTLDYWLRVVRSP